MASNTTLAETLRGSCPAPFYDESRFGFDGCFNTTYQVAEALNVVGLICLVFLLISYMVLPAEKTRRHYLSYCLIIAAMFMELGFVIPFGAQPEQCYDEITPNDMYSSLTCAFSGAFLISGGLSMAVWIFIRALSMHLQICWDVTPGKKFFYWAQGLGWSIAAAFFTITITITGVSFRFGDVCHVNAEYSMKDFWGPLLAIAGAAMVIQVATFVYCIKVYLQNMFSDEKTETQSSAGLPSYTTSIQTRSAKAVYRRVRKVLYLQWRGITIVVFILVDVIFFSIVFIWLNSATSHATENLEEIIPYVKCLMTEYQSNLEACFPLGQDIAIDQSTVTAILIMLSIAGLQVFFLLWRWSMMSGWRDFVRSKFSKNREFVSLDARNPTEDVRHFELKNFEQQSLPSAYTTPGLASYVMGNPRSDTPEHFHKEIQREYRSPTLSFSTPRPQSRAAHIDWDPRSSMARGGLGLHPPDYDTKI
ncbi:g protein-coupled receptor : secretin-like protein [Stemphylium lycopersici]|uniref:G protein-coupled receptor: secretin-like protein n=1 Tax=Stemphylium lycopersici TaxID=183478 RepID=A0A364NE52_STELY|nr:g protein-coupled receptor : secretin-like protein [Stemphylium lycopersici]RAR10134.1 g protein-coupled receptor : secretin-like protein [Stemphylium lycopersici]RAR15584.1 g protein-coupled receptor : secretin-like protein [Stemphylium lycopersici]